MSATLAEIDRAHSGIAADLGRRAAHQHASAHQHHDLPGETEHHVHVVLDDQDRDVGGQLVEHVVDDARLSRRNAGRRLVEQQHAPA